MEILKTNKLFYYPHKANPSNSAAIPAWPDYIAIVLVVILFAKIAGVTAVYADDSYQIIDSKKYPQGELIIVASPWQLHQRGSIKEWLIARADTPSHGQPVASKNLKVKNYPHHKNRIYVLRVLNSQTDGVQLSMLNACTQDNYSRLIDVSGPKILFYKNEKAVFRHIVNLLDKICTTSIEKNQKALAPISPTSPTAKSKPLPAEERVNISTSPLKKISEPQQLLGIWGLQTYGLQAGGMFGLTEDAIAVFKNGTLTTDIAGVFGQGLAESKKNNAKDWGHWRSKGDDIEIKWSKDNKYEVYDRWWKNLGGNNNHHLEGCFTRLSSSSGGAGLSEVMVGLSKTWCFSENGRFANKQFSFGNTPNVAISSAQAALQGRYRIDGHAMVLAYDNGKKVTVGFAYMSEEKIHIGINGVRYIGGK